MLIRAHRDQSGSMPLVILASIVVLGLVTVMFNSVLTSQRLTRFDQNFTTAFHGADAALQAGLAEVRALDPDGDFSDPTPQEGGDTTGDVTYEYSATKVGSEWQIRAEGEINGEARHMEATVIRPSLFFLAAFGKTLVGFKGGNVASSYDGGTTVPTGRGAVGTNGDIELNGSLSYDGSGNCTGNTCIDEMFLFGPDAECTKTTSNCNQIIGTPRENRESEPYVPEAEFIEKVLADPACQDSMVPYRSSTSPQLVGGAGPGPDGAYCFSSVNFDEDIILDASAEPVKIYTAGEMYSTNQVKINCDACIDRGFDANTTADQIELMLSEDPPDARALQIYSTGRSVALGNHTHMGAAVYAPNASCHGNPSAAQGYIYGSMVCNDISNQGGWSFYYDERLEEIQGSEWRIAGVREEGESTTSF